MKCVSTNIKFEAPDCSKGLQKQALKALYYFTEATASALAKSACDGADTDFTTGALAGAAACCVGTAI